MKKYIKENFPWIVFLCLLIIAIIAEKSFPLKYFTNAELKGHYLYLVNRTFSKFVFNLPLLLFVLLYIIYLISKKSRSALLFFGPLVIVLDHFSKGVHLLIHTNNFWQPDKTSFYWNTWLEYSNSTHIVNFSSLLIWLLAFYFLHKYFKNFETKAEEQKLQLDIT